jgi:ATP-dependent helicase/nuclease subunit B
VNRDEIQFLLVPDSGAARRLRRALVAESARTGLVVGVWAELLELARQSYLLEPDNHGWAEKLRRSLSELESAFWARSFEVAADETARTIGSVYTHVLTAAEPSAPFCSGRGLKLPARLKRNLRDLADLHRALAGALPDDLAAIRRVLGMGPGQAVRAIRVYCVDGVPRLNRWQQALVARLNAHAQGKPLSSLQRSLERLLLAPAAAQAHPTSLQRLQADLFSTATKASAIDDTVQWLGVRDFLEEAEVAAGMVQSLLASDRSLTFADLGLLIPHKFEYEVAVEDAFSLAGLPLAGLPKERWHRDLGREAVFHFLHCREGAPPAMALAACLSSPLMPWTRATGARLAQQLMDGAWGLEPWPGASAKARAMLALLGTGDDSPASLANSLATFVSLLEADERHADDGGRAQVACEQLRNRLVGQESLDWPALRREVVPHYLPSGEAVDYSLEGVTVWREGMEPWRAVRHLLVLGFAAGHYPVEVGASSVFSAADLEALAEAGSLALENPRERTERLRARFRRQLRAVSATVSFLIPRRDARGEVQAPSDSLAFMLHLFGADEEQVLDLDIAADRSRVRFVPALKRATSRLPTVRVAGDLELGRNLLKVRVDAEGKPKPESPSSLETMMVSPLAWLLTRVGAEPLGWAPEGVDVLLLGSLSHRVFERMFAQGGDLPARKAIPRQVEALLQQIIQQEAPFMAGAQWQVECKLLQSELTRAALAWHEVLTRLGAQVLGTETWLYGSLDKLPIHGQADALLGLPGKRALVVDYKKSGANGRRRRMEAGYDSQAHLYRLMLQTGGLKDPDRAALERRLKAASVTGIVYFMLNDATVLSDTTLPASAQVPVWNVFDNDVASEAIALIRQRVRELKRGRVRLNRADDAEFFERMAGVKPYAFETSPLVSLFMLPAEGGER